jgi:hypothetical protein
MTTIVSKQTTKEFQKSIDVSGLSMYYYDATCRVDLPKTKKVLGLKEKIKKVFITTCDHPEFKNEANKNIHYKTPIFAVEEQDGAYKYEDKFFGEKWVSDYPVGDVVVLN